MVIGGSDRKVRRENGIRRDRRGKKRGIKEEREEKVGRRKKLCEEKEEKGEKGEILVERRNR